MFRSLFIRRYIVEITIDDTLCDNCSLAVTTISTHYDPTAINTVTISCSGGSCNSDDIAITIDTGISVQHSSSYREDIDLGVTFESDIESFYFADAAVTVSKSDFSILKEWD